MPNDDRSYRGSYGVFDPSHMRTYPLKVRPNKVELDDYVDVAALRRAEFRPPTTPWFRSGLRGGGADQSAGLRELELKAMSAGSNPDGGYVVPLEIEQEIGRRLSAVSPIRSISPEPAVCPSSGRTNWNLIEDEPELMTRTVPSVASVTFPLPVPELR